MFLLKLGIWDSKVVCYVYIKLTTKYRKASLQKKVLSDAFRAPMLASSYSSMAIAARENLCVSFCGRNVGMYVYIRNINFSSKYRKTVLK